VVVLRLVALLHVSDGDTVALAALALLVPGFCVVRRASAFLLYGGAVAAAFAALTYRSMHDSRFQEWIVTTMALGAWAMGLSIVRTMLSRSASLQMLAGIDAGRVPAFERDIRARLVDLRRYHLVRPTDGGTALTTFGRLIGHIVAGAYRAVGMTA
jgi:hypothetical protein